MPLAHEQASRLVQLFAPSFDACQEQPTSGTGQMYIWQPVLTDIHQQVVHALGPVLVESHLKPGDPSPTLSLSLLAPPVSPLQPQVSRAQQSLADDFMPVAKPTL